MLFTLSACNSGVDSRIENETKKSEVFIKIYGTRIIEFEKYDIYEVGEVEKINSTDLDLEFYFNGKKIRSFITTEEEIKKMNRTVNLMPREWLQKFELKAGTYDLIIKDKNGNLKNDYKSKIVVDKGETIIEVNIGEYNAIGIDIGEIDVDEL